ncbi:MAG: hypothetical protein HY815_17775 [Candidatus Riflebacteria bacterium]|nr:hypothetical protein [Candidatus Riflebacteria bacterium]
MLWKSTTVRVFRHTGLAYALAATLSMMCDRPLTGAFLAYSLGVLGFLVNLMVIEKNVPWKVRRYMSGEIVFGLVMVLICLLLRGSLATFQTADLLDRKDRMRRALEGLVAFVLFFELCVVVYVRLLACCVRF